jgi:hypothetical protein
VTVVIPKALAWVLGVLLVVGISAAAFTAGTMLSSQVAATASPTVAASAPSSSASPTPTSTPTATATTAPTASLRTAAPTPTPVPTPLAFTSAQGGGATTSGKHTGIFGVVLANATSGYATQTRRMQVTAYIPTIGSMEKPSANAFVYNEFRAPAGGQAQIMGTIRWQGILAGNGAAGAGAAIKIDVKVLDGSTLVASQTVHAKEVRESALTVGGLDDVDQESFSFTANLQAGRLYRLQVEATCNAYTGFLGTVTHCIFGASDTYDDGFVEWTALSVRF